MKKNVEKGTKRQKGRKIDWEKYIGAWKDVDTERMKKEIKKERR